MLEEGNISSTAWMLADVPVWVQIGAEEPDTTQMFFQSRIQSLDQAGSVVYLQNQNKNEEIQDPQPQNTNQTTNNKLPTPPLPQCVAASKVFKRAILSDTLNVSDMVSMSVLNEPEIVRNLKSRFDSKTTYTYIGPTLIALNPYERLSTERDMICLDSCQRMLAEKSLIDTRELDPHTFAVAAQAYSQLLQRAKNQAIVISGESGAGKTENAKLAMRFLTSMKFHNKQSLSNSTNPEENLRSKKRTTIYEDPQLKPPETSIEDQIQSCNPILEAFGNAKTLRNDNSSRFGKYVHIFVDRVSQVIKRASISNYLLEKSRVTVQAKGERNYHIFYHMLKGLNASDKESLGIAGMTAESFNYLTTGDCIEVPSIDDSELFDSVRDSLENMGFIISEYQMIWRILSGILHIGNIKFNASTLTDNNPCEISTPESVTAAAKLLDIDVSILNKCLQMKTRKVGSEILESPLSEADTQINRDTIARTLYDRLFDWLIKRLNMKIFNGRTDNSDKHDNLVSKPQSQVSADNLCIGLLDIFGFEVFETNSFEQLCINYANERLQQLYIGYVFKSEESELAEQGLSMHATLLNYADNQPLIDLLDKYPRGIFDLLDESSALASSSDVNFFNKISTTHKTSPYFSISKTLSQVFVLKHTAKSVQYSADGFRAKNKQELSQDILDCLLSSKSMLIPEIINCHQDIQSDSEKLGSNSSSFAKNSKSDKFLSAKFRQQMKQLMEELMNSDCHFIRCIKPNEIKTSGLFLEGYVLIQIRYLGVLEAIKARQKGFPFRHSYPEFFNEFSQMVKTYRGQNVGVFKDNLPNVCQNICSELLQISTDDNNSSLPNGLLFGTSKIFANAHVSELFEEIHKQWNLQKNKFAQKIQNQIRVASFRRKIKLSMVNIIKISRFLRRSAAIFKMRVMRNRFQNLKAGVFKICQFDKKRWKLIGIHNWSEYNGKITQKIKILLRMLEIFNQINNNMKKQILKETITKFDNMPLKEMKNRTISKILQNQNQNNTSEPKISLSETHQNGYGSSTIEMQSYDVSEQTTKFNVDSQVVNNKPTKIINNTSLNQPNCPLSFDTSMITTTPEERNEPIGDVSFLSESVNMSLNFSALENPFLRATEMLPRKDSDTSSGTPSRKTTQDFSIKENMNSHEKDKNIDEDDDEKTVSLYEKYLNLKIPGTETDNNETNFSNTTLSPDASFDETRINSSLLERIKSNDYITFCKQFYKKRTKWGKEIPFEQISCYSPIQLSKPLSVLASQLIPLALKASSTILKYAGILPAKSDKTTQATKLIKLIFEQDQTLSDEVLLQITKQMQNCPSIEISVKFYQLMAVVSSCISASSRIVYPLLNFFFAVFTQDIHTTQIKQLAKFIFTRLRKTFQTQRVYTLSSHEIEAYSECMCVNINIEVYIGRTICVNAESYSDVSNILNSVLDELNIESKRSMYCLLERRGVNGNDFEETVLGLDEKIMDIFCSWENEDELIALRKKKLTTEHANQDTLMVGSQGKQENQLILRLSGFFEFHRHDIDAISSYYAQSVRDYLAGNFALHHSKTTMIRLSALKFISDFHTALSNLLESEQQQSHKQEKKNLHLLQDSPPSQAQSFQNSNSQDTFIKSNTNSVSNLYSKFENLLTSSSSHLLQFQDYFPSEAISNIDYQSSWQNLLLKETKTLLTICTTSQIARSLFLTTLRKRCFLFLSHQFQVIYYSSFSSLITGILALKPFEMLFLDPATKDIIDQFSLRDIRKFRKLSDNRLTLLLRNSNVFHLELQDADACFDLLSYYLNNNYNLN